MTRSFAIPAIILAAISAQSAADVIFDTTNTLTSISENGYFGDGTADDGPNIDNGFRNDDNSGVQFYGDFMATLDTDLRDYRVSYVLGGTTTTVVDEDSLVDFSWDFNLELINSPLVNVTVSAIGAFGKIEEDQFLFVYSDVSSDGNFTGAGSFHVFDGGRVTMAVSIEFVSGTAGDGVYVSIPAETGRGLFMGTVPAPGSLALLSAGGLLAARRRR